MTSDIAVPAIVLGVLALVWLSGRVTFGKRPVNFEYVDPTFLYHMELVESGSAIGMWKAIRQFDENVSLAEAKILTRGDLPILLENASARDVDKMCEALMRLDPQCRVLISCNQFERTFTLNEWGAQT